MLSAIRPKLLGHIKPHVADIFNVLGTQFACVKKKKKKKIAMLTFAR